MSTPFDNLDDKFVLITLRRDDTIIECYRHNYETVRATDRGIQ